MEWGSDQAQQAEERVRENSIDPLPSDVTMKYEVDAPQHWDTFYQQHQNRFFKDRHWLFTEFPELKGPYSGDQKFTIFEVCTYSSSNSEVM